MQQDLHVSLNNEAGFVVESLKLATFGFRGVQECTRRQLVGRRQSEGVENIA